MREKSKNNGSKHRTASHGAITSRLILLTLACRACNWQEKPSLPRTLGDWLLVAIATGVFVFFAAMARAPRMSFHWGPAALLVIATAALLAGLRVYTVADHSF